MPRIFLPDSDVRTGVVTLTAEKARYLSTVLRCKTGDEVIVKDNLGNTYTARICESTRRGVSLEILEKQDVDVESPLHLRLLQGLLKGEKMDLVIRKATELGVKEIMPVATERSQVRETRKLPRWKKIAEEASRQSGRNIIPVVHEPVGFASLFAEGSAVPPNGIIFWEREGEQLSGVLERFGNAGQITLFTGPEGGFSELEVRTASERGFVQATLGRRILRAETAAIAAVSIVQYVLGDLGFL